MLDANGCVNLIGAIINQAIRDYHNKNLKEHQAPVWEDAKDFLFKEGRLETFLTTYDMDQFINCDYIRQKAKDKRCVPGDDQ